MAHTVAIAKASLAASLLKPDPISLSKERIVDFHNALLELIHFCSPANVQRCRVWVSENILVSQGRILALGKYIAALGDSFEHVDRNYQELPSQSVLLAQRKRLHLLYMISDVLHHAKYHNGNQEDVPAIFSGLRIGLVALFQAVNNPQKDDQFSPKVFELLDIWNAKSYLSQTGLQELREAVTRDTGDYERLGNASSRSDADFRKEAPYIMPATHGEASTPFFDLPAGNIIPHIQPNSRKPISPKLIQPVNFHPGPAKQDLKAALCTFLEDIQYQGYSDSDPQKLAIVDFDPLGQPVKSRKSTSIDLNPESYYGWSHRFCQRMKAGQPVEMMGNVDVEHDEDLTNDDQMTGLGHVGEGMETRQLDSAAYDVADARRRSSSSSYSPAPAEPHQLPSHQSKVPLNFNEEERGFFSNSHLSQRPELIPPRPTGYIGQWPPPPPALSFDT